MAGIGAYGAYIPFNRLSRAVISEAWGKPALPGEKAVASYDEDSLTMAVAAARDCIKGIAPESIDGLYFASTTSPYREKQVASTIATVLNLNWGVSTADFGGSLRSGTNALRAAMDAVNSGSARNVLVCASDARLGFPNGDKETSFGDGAAALLISNHKVAAMIEASYTRYNEVMDVWRSDKDIYVRSWEDGFSYGRQYAEVVRETVSAALKKYRLTPKDFSKAVFYAPDSRQLGRLVRMLGFDLETQVPDLHSTVGNTGSALPLMSLVAALEQAKARDRILLASYGDGCDVFSFKVTSELENIQEGRRGIKGHLTVKRMLSSYERYLLWRGQVDVEPPRRVPLQQPSAVALWRDNKIGLAFYGVKCKHCGTPQYPPQRVCVVCRAKDEFEDYCFADKRGKVVNFSHDRLGATLDPPITIATVDFDGGGRARLDLTDRDLEEVKVGMPVEMTFRQIRFVGGIHDYWWKCRPVRD
jgi:hydroxymethylglutaryl-CoA synthase